MTDKRGGSGTSADQTEPAELIEQFQSVAEQSQKALESFWRRQADSIGSDDFSIVDHSSVQSAFAEWATHLMQDPGKLVEMQGAWWGEQIRLWQGLMGVGSAQPESDTGRTTRDRRFKDAAWDEDALYHYLKQSYLTSAHWMREMAGSSDRLRPEAQEKVDFYTRQFVSAMSPSNFVATNPAVLRKTRETGGQNLVEGFKHLLEDMEKGQGRLKISMTDDSAFEVGKTVAATPGKVVFENELMQLIQYSPTTDEVYQRPLLMVPPWINKFYILDLQQKNSFVRHALDQGHTIFLISWVNPDQRHADKSFEDYLSQGPLAAMDAIESATGEREINLLGFCIGGILVSTLLAYLARNRQANRVKAATFMTSLFDFDEVGEVSVFIDDHQIEQIRKHVADTGYLEGHHMAEMFSMMRENDLIWSFVVNNYLMGREPMPFDLLYWNSDSTRLPATMLLYYLEEIYRNNKLREPDGITLLDTPIDLSEIKTSTYIMASKDDHIAPWQSCYAGTQLLQGHRRFVLSASGHIAGVVNPPAAEKYGYFSNTELDADPEQWLENADWTDGSWWPDWYGWLARRAGDKVKAREPGEGELEIVEDAPGRYVKVRTDEAEA